MGNGETMKRLLICGIVLVFCFSSIGIALAQDDIRKFPSCKYCGMSRAKFAHTRVLLVYDNGTAQGTCSIHCAAIDLALNIDKTPKVIWVGDFNTQKLIDAEKAFWVIGGSKMGVMTKNAKWAFKKKTDAEKFMKTNGGKLATLDQVMKAAYVDMYTDTQMIRQKRKMKKMKMGGDITPVKPSPKDKCPVCGMFVAKYPDFLATIKFQDGTFVFFDGPKDMFKYYFDIKKYHPSRQQSDITAIYVTDYYTLTPIDAYKAIYVIGSNIYGPMGRELIPFKNQADAEAFMKDHTGQSLMKFKDVTFSLVKTLD